MTKNLQEAIRKIEYCTQDALTTAELNEAISFYSDLADKLRHMGPHFHLNLKYLNDQLIKMKDWADARKNGLKNTKHSN